ncbi:MAG: hypothetical protein S4CHLAM37_12700 [Chlamydiia bacterium]|nr:hypothetical protein [Chlamydiia bacterium]
METQFDVITTGDDTTLIQEYSPIYLNPNDVKINDTARGSLNCASIPSASCLSFKDISTLETEEDSVNEAIDLKIMNAIENEDYGTVKKMLDTFHPAILGSNLDLMTGLLYYTAYEIEVDLEKKVKFIDFILDYYTVDLNDQKVPLLPLALSFICEEVDNYDTPEEVFNDDMVFIAGYLIKKGARIDIDDSPVAEHLTSLSIRCFLLNIDKFPVASLERLCDGFEDLNKPFFKVYSEKFTLLEYIYYIHENMESSELCSVVEELLLKRGAKPPKKRHSINEEVLTAFLKAVEENDLKVMKRLLKEGVNPNYLYKNINRPIFSMVYQNENLSPKTLEVLLKSGVDPNQPVDSVSQGSVFEYFIEEDKVEHLKVLIKNGADVNQTFFSDSYNEFSDQISCISFFEYALTCGLFDIAALFARSGAEAIHNRIGSEALTMVQYVRNLIDEETDTDLLKELHSLEKVLIKKDVSEF